MSDYGILFFLAGDYTEENVTGLARLVHRMGEEGPWVLGPPLFVDETDFESCTSAEDEPIRTVGGFLKLNAPSDELPATVDRAHFVEVKKLVDVLTEFSAATKMELEFELGGTFVGDIVEGHVSELISIGLLSEWKKVLEMDEC